MVAMTAYTLLPLSNDTQIVVSCSTSRWNGVLYIYRHPSPVTSDSDKKQLFMEYVASWKQCAATERFLLVQMHHFLADSEPFDVKENVGLSFTYSICKVHEKTMNVAV